MFLIKVACASALPVTNHSVPTLAAKKISNPPCVKHAVGKNFLTVSGLFLSNQEPKYAPMNLPPACATT